MQHPTAPFVPSLILLHCPLTLARHPLMLLCRPLTYLISHHHPLMPRSFHSTISNCP